MFFKPKNAIAICVAAVCLYGSVTVNAQTQNNSEFNRRMAALQQARQRTETVVSETHEVAAQSAPRIARAAYQGSGSRIAPSTSGIAPSSSFAPSSGFAPSGGFTPGHLQNSQFVDGTIIDGGSPIVQGGIINGGYSTGQVIHDPIGSSVVSNGVVMGQSYGGEIVSESYGGSAGGCSDGSCGNVGESYFADDCCGRGGCPAGGPCYLNQFGKVFQNAEYFGGFNAFRTNLFNAPDGSGLADDNSHGLYAGLNMGIPLCRLTCGFLSGQFGVRTVNTNFNGARFTDDDRNQVFITAGLFRRVDYGLQYGAVVDYLREEWFANADLIQIRSEVSYVWQGGTSFGFRFARNAQDDATSGDFNNVPFTNNLVSTNQWFRFFARHEMASGGYGEVFGGYSDTDQGIVGLDLDFPITNRIAFQSNFVYYIADDDVPANQGFIGGDPNDAFNVSVGFALRPGGRNYYRNYERPLFDVADNGTMTITRQ